MSIVTLFGTPVRQGLARGHRKNMGRFVTKSPLNKRALIPAKAVRHDRSACRVLLHSSTTIELYSSVMWIVRCTWSHHMQI